MEGEGGTDHWLCGRIGHRTGNGQDILSCGSSRLCDIENGREGERGETDADGTTMAETMQVVETIQRGEGDGKVSPLTMELDSLSSVRQCAKDFLKQEKQLHVLILNAGEFVSVICCSHTRQV
jgi:hypothetical protein